MPRLLLIDDDEQLGAPLAAYFRRFQFDLQHATRPSEGLRRLRQGGFDVAILDVMLPEMDGFELCRTIRKESNIPIVMLTAELLARIQTILRRAAPANGHGARQLRFEGGLAIDLDRRTAQRDDLAIELTSTEFDLLVMLAQAPSKVFSRDDILEKLRGQSAEDIHTRAVDILVSRLRRKLEPLDCIKTLRNAGYTFAGVRV